MSSYATPSILVVLASLELQMENQRLTAEVSELTEFKKKAMKSGTMEAVGPSIASSSSSSAAVPDLALIEQAGDMGLDPNAEIA
jgi:hypothetical protein